ncbi:MAG: serpin family protein [Chloroflexi bacterium]|nr:serpin family protein [Chloroflexota bacterium]
MRFRQLWLVVFVFVLMASSVHASPPPDAVTELVAGNNAFAFDLYQALRSEEGNRFFSPYSISAALAMTYGGARGDTESAMAGTLHFTLGQEGLHPAFSELRASMPNTDGELDFRLNIANRLWGQSGYGFLPDYLALLDANYSAGLQELDFAADPEDARLTINDWIAGETEQRITELLPPGIITGATRLVLTNAIYFQAAWLSPFPENRISDEAFTRLDGSTVMTPFMRDSAIFGYLAGDGYQVVQLFYEGEQARMLIIVPDAGTFEAFERELDPALLDTILAEIAPRDMFLTMPLWESTSEFDLAAALAGMGMAVAFGPGASFSGMTGSSGLFISSVIHQATVTVDHKGTEAAAATAVIMGLGGGPGAEDPVRLTLDRPFIYLIMDTGTNSVLFMGRVLDPAQ